jgi:protein transport protein SEC61 subunit alpha
MTFRLLNLVRPFLAVLPDVAPPEKRLPFSRRALFTVVALLIYLICSRLPLYGIRTSQSADPMYWIRVIFASSRGTTMELGISPVVTSGLVIQLLVGSKLLDIDTSVKSDMDLMCDPTLMFARIASFCHATRVVHDIVRACIMSKHS